MNSHETSPSGAPTDAEAQRDFFVVGIGASAGGLEALTSFVAHTDIDNAAFVVLQHLSPALPSLLPELLGRVSRLRVETATDGASIRANRVYVAPPNVELRVEHGAFALRDANGERLLRPIDHLFASLAQQYGARSVGVVLSGTGTDGTEGLKAIKAAGGVAIVQDPATAKFDGMPRSAINAGAADYAVPPERIFDEVMRATQRAVTGTPERPSPRIAEQLDRLVPLLKRDFGLDLTHYKPNTIERRLQRRMALHRLDRIDDYIALCARDREELAQLHADLLINVTSFFREADSFVVLKEHLLPQLLKRKSEADTLRIWVPGCSTGEEAYSIIICLYEVLDATHRTNKVQLFGTDVDGDAIAAARRGVYDSSIAEDVAPERLRQFFVRLDDNRYQVTRRVRDAVVFSLQNISRDAPFSRLDLVSCRNLLIYLQPTIQKKVLRTLHYSLKPEGYLLLGASESIGDSTDLFSLVDRKNKVYVAKHSALSTNRVEVGAAPALPGQTNVAAHPNATRPMISVAQLADRKILEQYAPPGVVINESLDILYFRGNTTSYLEQPSGAATHNILRLVRAELHIPLRQAIETAFRTGEPFAVQSEVRDEARGFRPVTVLAQPIVEPDSRARCLLLLFKEERGGEVPSTAGRVADNPAEERHRALQQELALTRDYLQSTIEDLERTNEDLKSSNEELQSSNEELQSTNEELETSKEELQSSNEELITVNEELQRRMSELGGANDDLRNLLAVTPDAIVFVDLDGRIRRYTDAAERVLNVVAGDLGRSVSLLDAFIGGAGIESMVSDAIKRVTDIEREIQARDHAWYRLRIAPYKTAELAIRGAVVSFNRIDGAGHGYLIDAVDQYATQYLSAVLHPLVIVNQNRRIVWANDTYARLFGTATSDVVGVQWNEGRTKEWAAQVDQRLQDTLASGQSFSDFAVTSEAAGAARLGGSRIRGVANETPLVLLTVERVSS